MRERTRAANILFTAGAVILHWGLFRVSTEAGLIGLGAFLMFSAGAVFSTRGARDA